MSSPPSTPWDPYDLVLNGEELAIPSRNGWPESFVTHLEALHHTFEREKRQLQDLFASLSFALRAFNNVNQILELIPLLASRLTHADGGALLLFHDNGTVQLERLHCLDTERAQMQAMLENLTHSVRDVPEPPLPSAGLGHFLDDQFQQQLGSQGQILGVPLLIRNIIRGRLYVFSHNPHWDRDSQQKLLQIIADQAAVAIENHELAGALQHAQTLVKEVEIGSDVQHSLFPRQCPEIPGLRVAARFEAASQVGGDYYDFIPLREHPIQESVSRDPDNWAIVIGDVMGKGVPAGMIMTATRSLLRVLTQHHPAQVLRYLNRTLFQDLDNSNRFITLFCSEYNPHTRQLTYSNAAHNPVLWWQAHNGTLTSLDSDGPLIGLDAESLFEQKTVQLQPGDVLVYYTDGFTEASNRRGERWELEGLEKAVQWAARRYRDPNLILESLYAQVRAFQQSQPSTALAPAVWGSLSGVASPVPTVDDMTMVVVKVLGDAALCADTEETTSLVYPKT
ncbi:MAG: SpoIIE family protein phosphatase [Synechococcales cyanobacterium]